MYSYSEWMNSRNPASHQATTGPQNFSDWMIGRTPPGPLEMPKFEYEYTIPSDSKAANKALSAESVLTDYYGALANEYLPILDTWASDNAGRMVAYDPNALMTAADFGWTDNRGAMRGAAINTQFVGDRGITQQELDGYYYQNGVDDGGNTVYQPVSDTPYWITPIKEGMELFRLNTNGDGYNTYDSVGNYTTKTAQDAVNEILAKGGANTTGTGTGYKSGKFYDTEVDNPDINNGYDFFNTRRVDSIALDNGSKWGADNVNIPELQKYLDDPEWVQRDEKGNVTAVRAELMPYITRQGLSSEVHDMTRGLTKESGGLGDIVKAGIIGIATGGLGMAGAGALGLTGTAATVAGGAIGGGLSSAIQGGNVLEGALLGGVTGGLNKLASPVIGNSLGSMGISNPLVVKGVTGGITGGVTSAIKGGNPISGLVGGATSALGSQLSSQYLGDVNPFIRNMVTGVGTDLAKSALLGTRSNTTGAIIKAGTKSFDQWFNSAMKG